MELGRDRQSFGHGLILFTSPEGLPQKASRLEEVLKRKLQLNPLIKYLNSHDLLQLGLVAQLVRGTVI